MASLPTGTVSFLFTDLEGSTRLWEQHPDAMRDALARHDAILRDAVQSQGGHVVKSTGDGIHGVFLTPESALAAAVDAQRRLGTEPWDGTTPLRVRMGMHVGSAEARDGDYFGSAVNRAARLMQVGHGGQIIVSGAIEELARDSLPAGVSFRPLGTHRLRDLTQADHIFDVVGPGLESNFPPLRSVEAFPSNIPFPVTSFVGRDADVVEVGELLREARVVTLTGVGGVGKTRLAAHVAADMLPRFADGAWLCELGPVSDANAVPEVLAATLSIQPRPGANTLDTVVDGLRHRELLIVLDNCEHVIAPAARTVDAIVHACAGVRVLATSREGLGTSGERLFLVRSLALPGDEPDEVTAQDSEAVRLFLDRANAARRGFALSDDNLAAVVQICRRLDGIPLAIELAAARVRMLSAAEIADRLDERFRLLTGGSRTAVERHQTLRAAVDWSYDLLEPAQQLLLDRLGVFAGGFTLDGAEAVGVRPGSELEAVLDELGQLVDKSLVITEDAADGATRYRLLETIRQYALAHLDDAGVTDDTRRLHAQWCIRLVTEAGTGSHGPHELSWTRRIRRELDNIRAAITWATGIGDTDVSMNLIGRFEFAAWPNTPFLWAMGPWAAAALALPNALENPSAASVLALHAADHLLHNRVDDAEREALAAIELALEPDRPFTPYPWGVLLRVYALSRRGQTIVEQMHDCVEGARARGDQYDLSFALFLAALTSFTSGQPASEGIENAEESLRLALAVGAPSIIGAASSAVSTLIASDDPDRALALAELSLEHAVELDHGMIMMTALSNIGRIGRGAGDARLRAARFRDLLDRTYEAGDLGLVGILIETYTSALFQIDRADPAAKLFGFVERDTPMWSPGGANRHNALREDLVSVLGQARFDELVDESEAMALIDAITLARRELDRVINESTVAGIPNNGLPVGPS